MNYLERRHFNLGIKQDILNWDKQITGGVAAKLKCPVFQMVISIYLICVRLTNYVDNDE